MPELPEGRFVMAYVGSMILGLGLVTGVYRTSQSLFATILGFAILTIALWPLIKSAVRHIVNFIVGRKGP